MKTKKEQSASFDSVLIKYLTGSATAEERESAISWINENAVHEKYFDELKDYYQLSKLVQKPSGYNKEEGWNRVKNKYFKLKSMAELDDKRKSYTRKLIYISISSAAAIFIAFFIGFYTSKLNYTSHKNISAMVYNEVVVPLGAKSQVTLSDGSKIWLNAGSKLRYPVDFSSTAREVYLEGEAYFDVAKMQHKLFIVKTSNLNIKVYGTQFNVKAYMDENQIQTTLVRGSVAIEPTSDNSNKYVYFLKPNQTATFFKTTSLVSASVAQKPATVRAVNNIQEKIFVVDKIDPIPIISWKDKQWIFKGEELDQLAVKLERRYNVKISFEDESLKKYKFSGTLTDLTFEQVLMVIQLSAPILFKIEGNNVAFKENVLYKKKYDQMISKTKNITN